MIPQGIYSVKNKKNILEVSRTSIPQHSVGVLNLLPRTKVPINFS